jgi:pyruvate/2-oxoglutarate dehydrogenase complex dihydrolipoamide acyltransferase (E2) component
MPTPVLLPDLGPAPVRLTVWYAAVGDQVYEGDRLVEVLIPGATFDVPAPATGRLVERLAWPRELLTPGQVLGLVEAETDDIPLA